MKKLPTMIQVNKISASDLEKLNKAGITVSIPKVDTQITKMEHAAKQALERGNVTAAKQARLQMLKLIHTKNKGN